MLEGKAIRYSRAFKTRFETDKGIYLPYCQAFMIEQGHTIWETCRYVISEQHSNEREHFRDVHTVQSRCIKNAIWRLTKCRRSSLKGRFRKQRVYLPFLFACMFSLDSLTHSRQYWKFHSISASPKRVCDYVSTLIFCCKGDEIKLWQFQRSYCD